MQSRGMLKSNFQDSTDSVAQGSPESLSYLLSQDLHQAVSSCAALCAASILSHA